jgi:hypothetical protein
MSNNNTRRRKAKKTPEARALRSISPALGIPPQLIPSMLRPPENKVVLRDYQKLATQISLEQGARMFRAGPALGKALKDLDYKANEEAWTANALSPERDQYGRPVWPANLKLNDGRHPLAGEYGKLCFRTDCQRPNAVWYNRGSHHYYCEDCAHMLNRENARFGEKFSDGRPMCVLQKTADEDCGAYLV